MTSILQLRLGSAINDRPLSSLTSFSFRDSSASTISAWPPGCRGLGRRHQWRTSSLEPCSHSLSYVCRYVVPVTKAFLRLDVRRWCMMMGQRALSFLLESLRFASPTRFRGLYLYPSSPVYTTKYIRARRKGIFLYLFL